MKRSLASREVQWLLEEKYHGRLTPLAKKDIALLQKGKHVDYVIGFVDFLGCKIDLFLKPFIPRPETEYWVENAIECMLGKKVFSNHSSKSLRDFGDCALGRLPFDKSQGPCQTASEGLFKTLLPLHRQIQDTKYKIQVLDLFAGSGCIGIAVLKYIPSVVVDFGEKDKRLFSQIRKNAKNNGIKKTRYRVIHTDIFSGVKNKKYDFIFANPPYIAESRKNKVQASVLKHEPRKALFAGKDGLDIIRPFLNQAKEFLASNGRIYLEFDSFQKSAIERYVKKVGYQSWEFYKDQYGKWRHVKIVYNREYGSRQRAPASSAGRSR